MKRSFYIYNNGQLKRKDNSIEFIDETGERRYIPIETVDEIYVMSEMDFNTNLINFFVSKLLKAIKVSFSDKQVALDIFFISKVKS